MPHGRRRTGSRSRSRRSSARTSSPRCRPSWIPTSRPPCATLATSTCCALVSCGMCGLSCVVRQTPAGYRYYICRGRTDGLRVAQGQRCTARYIPAGQLDELVWADLCALLTEPAQLTRALDRARGGAWLPQELQARHAAIRQALRRLERQQQQLLDAYLAEVIDLAELERKRDGL